MIKKKKKKAIYSRYIIALAALAVIGVAALLVDRHYTHSKKTSITIPSNSQATSPAPSSSSSTSSTSQTTTPPPPTTNDKTTPPAPAATTPPITPTGTFVSNHRPSLSGQSSPSQEVSYCNTTPGATCHIEFTSSATNTTYKLTEQATNSYGTVYWTWDVKTAGLTTGTWRVTAIATLNGQTRSASDSTALEVQP